jgi:hypothetical protein
MKKAGSSNKPRDDNTIIDVMEVELSASSNRQDASAKSKFEACLERVRSRRSFDKLKKTDITKELIGRFCSYLLEDKAVNWQTSMNYLSSIRRQMEESLGTKLFKEEPEWYKKCRRNLHQKYVINAIATGKPLKEQSPTMTFNDLTHLCKGLFMRNTAESLMDRTLLNNQWLAVGRSSDIGNLSFNDLHWHDHFLLIDLTRYVTCSHHTPSCLLTRIY